MKDNITRERGSIVILLALALTVLLGCGAVVMDLGIIYSERVHLQNAVNAAALAGCQELPGNTVLAQQIAQQYAGQNGIPVVNINFEDNNLVIDVSTQKEVPTFFARIWGITNEEISVQAKAMMVPPQALTGVIPLSIEQQQLVYGEEYVLKVGAGHAPEDDGEEDDQHNGWFGALALGGNGADVYRTNLENGYAGTLRVGQVVSVEHGNMSGPTAQGINDRLSEDNNCPRNTFNDYERGAPEIVYVPVVKTLNDSGNSIQEVQIAGFAAFFLEGVAGNGNDSIVTGRFIQTFVSNSATSSNIDDLKATEMAMEQGDSTTDFGLYTPKLLAN